MTQTPSSQPDDTPAAPPPAGAGVGEGRFLAVGLLLAIAQESGDSNVLADLDDYFPSES